MSELDNGLIGPGGASGYQASMVAKEFRARFLAAFEASGMSMAELSRRSGVPYHTIVKLRARETATTGHENAVAIASILGIDPPEEPHYDELRAMLNDIQPERRETAVEIVRGVLAAYRGK